MTAFKILLPAGAILTTGIMLTSIVTATTYTTTVNIDYQVRTLSWEQKTPMQFATVVFNDDTANGQICHTDSNKKQHNTLCPGARSTAKNADYEIKGIPNATVLVNLSTAASTVEGVEFQPLLIGENELKLDKKGQARYDIGGQLTLIDGSQTTSQSLTFSYELEFTAQ